MSGVLPAGLRWRDLITVALSAVVGAVLVAALGLLSGVTYSATALVNGGPGPSASLPLDLSTDVTQRYVATELIYIDTLTEQMATDITARTGVSDPAPVVSSQEGSTNVIKMSAVGETPEQAAEMANIAADTYIRNWRERTAKDPEATPADLKSDRYVERALAADAVKTTSLISLVLLGLVLGFAIGCLIVYLQHRRRSIEADDA